MLKSKLFIFTVFSFFLIQNTISQHINRESFCNHNQSFYDKISSDPFFKKSYDSIQNLHKQYVEAYKQSSASRAATIYYIPVVYHVLHEGGVENISNEQILDDLEQLNILFRKQNASANNVNSAFTAVDIEIEFRLAQKKDDGSCFNGITRTFSSATNESGRVNAVASAHGPFPGNKYLNIFVAKDLGGPAGYTTRPWSNAMSNGIYVLHQYVGRIGTSVQTTENATMAHEAGHWLSLPHLWGGSNTPNVASNCNLDDGIGDTPNTIGWTSCNPNGSSCGTLDNVENIMEYSYCQNHMFTNGQRTEMRAAALSPLGGRSNVTSSANHSATGIFDDILCEADFNSNMKIACEGRQIQFFDNSYHNATSWNWSFPGGTPSSSAIKNPIIVYNTPGVYDVSLTVTNASGTKSISKTDYTYILGEWGMDPYSEGFENLSSYNSDWFTNTNGTKEFEIINTSSFSGANSVFLENFSNDNASVTDFSSTTIRLDNKSSASLSYRYAYAKKTNTAASERVQLFISKNCGESWILIKSLFPNNVATNSFFTPSGSGDWNNQTVNISPAFFSADFRYMFRVTNGGGNNLYIDDININAVAGIENIDNLNSFSIYPNPFSDKSTLEFNLKNASDVDIEVLDLVGKIVKPILSKSNLNSGTTYKYEINKEGLTPGVYFVKMTIDEKVRLTKVLVQ